jgi:anti-sigma regulatory factor (Ser/Thr protein kinase)
VRASVKAARNGVLEYIAAWKLSQTLRDDTLLVVSELVTNAVMHARGAQVLCGIRLSAEERQCTLRVEVHDGQAEPDHGPQPCRPGPCAESGRGLLIVQELAMAWGTERSLRLAGYMVWAELCVADGEMAGGVTQHLRSSKALPTAGCCTGGAATAAN